MMVPGGGFTIDVLPIFAKNRALPFFLTMITASLGLNEFEGNHHSFDSLSKRRLTDSPA